MGVWCWCLVLRVHCDSFVNMPESAGILIPPVGVPVLHQQHLTEMGPTLFQTWSSEISRVTTDSQGGLLNDYIWDRLINEVNLNRSFLHRYCKTRRAWYFLSTIGFKTLNGAESVWNLGNTEILRLGRSPNYFCINRYLSLWKMKCDSDSNKSSSYRSGLPNCNL